MKAFSAAGSSRPVFGRGRLLRSTALSGAAAAMLVLAPQAARAADECGAPVEGVVTCPADAELPNGVHYVLDPAAPQDLTVVLEDGLTIGADGHIGVVAGAFQGAVTVSGAGAGIVTTGSGASGVFASTNHGDVTVDIGSVLLLGDHAGGIDVSTADGDVSIKAGSVAAYGDAASGVEVLSTRGDVSIEIGSVSTQGDDSWGIRAFADDGAIDVEVGTVATAGDNSVGVMVRGLGGAQDAGEQAGPGVFADPGVLDVSVTAGSVSTSGYASDGVSAVNYAAGAATTVTVGEVSTRGAYSYGIYAAGAGEVVVDAGSVTTLGLQAKAIEAVSVGGDITVTAGTIQTGGVGATGVNTINYSQDGATVVTVGSLLTKRDYADGVHAVAYGDITVAVGEVATKGFASLGVSAQSLNGDIVVSVGDALTTGAYSTAVYASSDAGDVTVTTGVVHTTGEFSAGVRALSFAGDVVAVADRVTVEGPLSQGMVVRSVYGDVTVQANAVSATGQYGSGVLASSLDGDVSVTVGTVTTSGDLGGGVLSVSYTGNDHVVVGAVSTAGDFATGVRAQAGQAVSVVAGQVTTSGAYSNAVMVRGDVDASVSVQRAATTGDGSSAVSVSSAGGLHIVAASVTTSGADASGVVARNHVLYGGGGQAISTAMDIRAGTVAVTGARSKGISVVGLGDVSVDAGATSSAQAEAIDLRAAGAAHLTIRGLTASATTDAVVMSGHDVSVTIGAGGGVSGGANGLVLTAIGDDDPDAPGPVAPTGLITVANAGAVSAKDGYAVLARQGVVDLTNSGRIDGAIKLADGDDRVANAGLFAAAGASDFGAGEDVFANTGVLRAAGSVALLGLERFENAGGLVDLRDGHAGDVLTLSGDYVASGDARLGLDLGDGVWDSLVVQGAASGKTAVVLGLAPTEATLATPFARAGEAGIAAPATPLIQLGAGSTASFEIANPDVGLIHYGLTFDPATSSFSLAAAAGAPVYATLDLQDGTRHAWRRSAEAWSAHRAALRDDSGAEAGRTWVQAYGSNIGWNGYDQTDQGVQVGRDLGARSTRFGELAWGVTGGYAASRMEAQAGAGESELETLDLGAYAGLVRGATFVDGLVKYDRHRIRTSDSQAGYHAKLDGGSFGAQLEAGRRFGGERLAFEPTVSLAYVRTALDDVKALGQTLAFDDADALTGQIGARVSGARQVSGTDLVFFAGASAARTFAGDGGLTFESGGVTQALASGDEDAWGQASLGVSARLAHGLTTYLEGEGAFGGREGLGLRLGARFNF